MEVVPRARWAALVALVVAEATFQMSCASGDPSHDDANRRSGSAAGSAAGASDASVGRADGGGVSAGGGTTAASGGGSAQGGGGTGSANGGTGASGSSASGGAGGASGTGGSGGSSASGGSGGTSGAGGTGSGGTGGGMPCSPTQLDCNGDPGDGCESDTTSDVNNCGLCGNDCPSGANATAGCVSGYCDVTCDGGYADCDGKANTGCEVHTDDDALNCKTCGNVCASGPNSTPVCAFGRCSLTCDPPYGDCDAMLDTGCETDLLGDARNCGYCNNDCGTKSCVTGSCECASTTQTAQQIPLDMYIMLDQSGSMTDQVAGGQTKWQAVTTAISGFVNDAKNAGIGVGIQYFALPRSCPFGCGGGCDQCAGSCGLFVCVGGGESCVAADYANPEVGIAVLPGNAGAIVNSMSGHSPSTNTPTAPALQGAINYAKSWATSHPTHAVVDVLATDGNPTECSPQDIPSIANIAAQGCGVAPKVSTFVIGVGNSTSNLNAIAAGGCTTQAYIVDTTANAVAQFEAALEAIRGRVLGCDYLVPQPSSGTPDYARVNVQYTLTGGAPIVVNHVTDKAACNATTGGWYYDLNPPATPTRITLCPATCATVQADSGAKVDILLGCPTIG